MSIEKLERRKGTEANRKLTKSYDKIERLIKALDEKEIPAEGSIFINEEIKLINSFSGTEMELIKLLRKKYSRILAFVRKEFKYVTKHQYLSLCMVFGMLAGIVFSSVFGSFDFIGMGSSTGIGISMGMIIGIIVGINLDQKAEREGKQLEIEAE